MPTAKVTKNVSAAIGGGNVMCSTLISIKTKAWLYSFPLAVGFRINYVKKTECFVFAFPVAVWPNSECAANLILSDERIGSAFRRNRTMG